MKQPGFPGQEKHSIQYSRLEATFDGKLSFYPHLNLLPQIDIFYTNQAERELLDMFEDSEDSRDHPKMMDVVQGALQAEGFSLSSIRNSDVRHPVDG